MTAKSRRTPTPTNTSAPATELGKDATVSAHGAEQSAPTAGAAPIAQQKTQPTHLLVRSLVEGFRRAGKSWSKKETLVAVEDFTAEQIQALLAEPHLVVLSVADETAAQ